MCFIFVERKVNSRKPLKNIADFSKKNPRKLYKFQKKKSTPTAIFAKRSQSLLSVNYH